MRLSDLAGLAFTYPDVGATAGELPDGYHHVRAAAQIGTGRARFDAAADAVLRWGMQRGVGMRVDATTVTAAPGTDMLGRLGPMRVPCRVVYVVDEPDRRGFAYGTLPGHPETGEELFCVRPDDGRGLCRDQRVLTARHLVEPPRLACRTSGTAADHPALSARRLSDLPFGPNTVQLSNSRVGFQAATSSRMVRRL